MLFNRKTNIRRNGLIDKKFIASFALAKHRLRPGEEMKTACCKGRFPSRAVQTDTVYYITVSGIENSSASLFVKPSPGTKTGNRFIRYLFRFNRRLIPAFVLAVG